VSSLNPYVFTLRMHHFSNTAPQIFDCLVLVLWSKSSPPQVTESAKISGELCRSAVCRLEDIYIVQGHGESLDEGLTECPGDVQQ